MTLDNDRDCLSCNGAGFEPCSTCRGTGRKGGLLGFGRKTCDMCDGQGKTACFQCDGTGREQDVTIPPHQELQRCEYEVAEAEVFVPLLGKHRDDPLVVEFARNVGHPCGITSLIGRLPGPQWDPGIHLRTSYHGVVYSIDVRLEYSVGYGRSRRTLPHGVTPDFDRNDAKRLLGPPATREDGHDTWVFPDHQYTLAYAQDAMAKVAADVARSGGVAIKLGSHQRRQIYRCGILPPQEVLSSLMTH